MKRVVVVGAGPAGSAAAMALTRYPGVEVLLLERASFPRCKPCGSGLSPWTLDLLQAMDLGATIRKEAYPIKGAVIGGARGQPIEIRSKYEAAVLLRARFDMLLAHEAARRGADLREGIKVEEVMRAHGRVVGVRTAQDSIETDAVIVCNGANTTQARAPRPGKTLRTIMGWYEDVEGVSDAVELYFDPMVKPFYGWVFPESKQRVNIGICYDPLPGSPNARQRFDAFLDHRLAGRMRTARQIDKLVGHPIATSYRPTALVQQGMLVAGEAGHLVDPATAEGIHHALASGQIAGQFLGSLLDHGLAPSEANLAPYTGLIRKRLGRRLAAGQLFLRAAQTPILDFALSFGSWKPVKSLLTWALAGA